jgi:hypothetical protein
MEEYKRLKTKLSEGVYNELQLWWVNNLNLTEKQARDFANLIDKISTDSKVVKNKALVKV